MLPWLLKIDLLKFYVDFSLHKEFVSKPHCWFFKGGFLEVKSKMEQVAEFVMFKNVNNCVLLVISFLVFHNAEESVHLSLLLTFFISYAKVKQSHKFFWESREIHEDVLLISHSNESLKIYLSLVEKLRITIITDWYSQVVLHRCGLQISLSQSLIITTERSKVWLYLLAKNLNFKP